MISQKYISEIKNQFPIFETKVNDKRLVYLDNAATTQKPFVVINSLTEYYKSMNANVHRGVHYLSECATKHYENTREKIAKFINAEQEECIFVRGTTEGINLISNSISQSFSSGDEILLTEMEHHSNIVPWQLLADKLSLKINYIPLTPIGELDLSQLDALLTKNTKLLGITHISNSIGTINPIKEIISKARQKNIIVLVDGTQAPAHVTVDVKDLDCDFYTISAHKWYGPMGVGIVYGKKELLESLPPYHGGGEMILEVSKNKSVFNKIPYKFEAGTPSVADTIAWGAAIDFFTKLNLDDLFRYEQELLSYATEKLNELDGLQIIGTAKNKISIISFVLNGIHPHDMGTIANEHGVAIRTGHHCTMPLMKFYDITGTSRASLCFYNTFEDIDILCKSILTAKKMFGK